MSLYVLDTDHVTLHQRSHPSVIARIKAAHPDELAITVITVEEQMRGRLAQIGRPGIDPTLAYDQLRATAAYFCDLTILRFDQEAQREYGRLRSQGIRIGTLDLRIAAVALARNAVLITRNHSDFGQVPGLSLDDWSRRLP